jgi:hypothetical protein
MVAVLKLENMLVCKENRWRVIGKHHAENALCEVENGADLDGIVEECKPEECRKNFHVIVSREQVEGQKMDINKVCNKYLVFCCRLISLLV